jgi:hypothetical protein
MKNLFKIIFVMYKWITNIKKNLYKWKKKDSAVDKKKTESVATGNCKVYPSELSNEKYDYYKSLREKIYEFNKQKINVFDC